MPELPEVEVVRRGLERWVAGRTKLAAEQEAAEAAWRSLTAVTDGGPAGN